MTKTQRRPRCSMGSARKTGSLQDKVMSMTRVAQRASLKPPKALGEPI